MNDDRQRAISLLSDAERWLVLAHVKPDGDTLGSAAAIAGAGMRASKSVLIGCPDVYPEKYSFLVDGIDHEVLDAIPERFTTAGAAIICVDTSSVERAVNGIADHASTIPLINIDHHVDNERFGTIDLIESAASSTGEVVASLLKSSPWGITKREAEALYVAMITDNGHFSFSSTSIDSHRCAITLLENGVSPSEIADRLNATMPHGALLLWARAFSRSEVFADGSAAIMWIEQRDFDETSTDREHLDELTNFLLKIRGVKLCALGTEVEGGSKFSVRSVRPVSARRVASRFGGGGHEQAAGCSIHAPLDKAIAMIREEMESELSSIR